MKSPLSQDVTPCSPLFGACFTLVSCLAYTSMLKLEVTCSSKMFFCHLTGYTTLCTRRLNSSNECKFLVTKYVWYSLPLRYKRSMSAHLKVECGKEPQLPCPYCPHRSKKNHHLAAHIRAIHKDVI